MKNIVGSWYLYSDVKDLLTRLSSLLCHLSSLMPPVEPVVPPVEPTVPAVTCRATCRAYCTSCRATVPAASLPCHLSSCRVTCKPVDSEEDKEGLGSKSAIQFMISQKH